MRRAFGPALFATPGGGSGITVAALVVFSAALACASPRPALAACPERPACHGCGCKGGPGYRGPDGRCVGFGQLDAVCGVPPETRCVFENAPGTGANRDCALGTAPKRARPLRAAPGE